jgi:hypothetical protein
LAAIDKLRDFVFPRKPATGRESGIDEINSRALLAERREQSGNARTQAKVDGIIGNVATLHQCSRYSQHVGIALRGEASPATKLRGSAVSSHDHLGLDGFLLAFVFERNGRIFAGRGGDVRDGCTTFDVRSRCERAFEQRLLHRRMVDVKRNLTVRRGFL